MKKKKQLRGQYVRAVACDVVTGQKKTVINLVFAPSRSCSWKWVMSEGVEQPLAHYQSYRPDLLGSESYRETAREDHFRSDRVNSWNNFHDVCIEVDKTAGFPAGFGNDKEAQAKKRIRLDISLTDFASLVAAVFGDRQTLENYVGRLLPDDNSDGEPDSPDIDNIDNIDNVPKKAGTE